LKIKLARQDFERVEETQVVWREVGGRGGEEWED